MEKWWNDDQGDYMSSLAKLPRDKLCGCGWFTQDDCHGIHCSHPDKKRARAKPTPSPDYLRGLEAAREIVRQYGLPSSMPGHEIVRNILDAIETLARGDQ